MPWYSWGSGASIREGVKAHVLSTGLGVRRPVFSKLSMNRAAFLRRITRSTAVITWTVTSFNNSTNKQ